MRGDARLGAILVVFVLSVVIFSQAGPVSRVTRMLSAEQLKGEPISQATGAIQELTVETTKNTTIDGGCTFGDRSYAIDEIVPSLQLCETCLCTENGIQCSPIICKIQPGCKALHRADHCCPLYQCECERNGVKYSNGEKIMDPENPCQVCYCQGGAILCNPIACYRRDDCEPRYVPGRCCPEYDHCPPRDSTSQSSIQEKYSTHRPEMNKISDITTVSYSNDSEGMITENIKQFVLTDDSNSKENSESDESDSSKNINQNKNVPTLNIKEVTVAFEKPINNEIRIKEVLPTVNNDFSSTDNNKSPTIPREATYTDQNKEIVSQEVDIESGVKIKNDTDNYNFNVYQTPPILRIGDQLLFLTDGDFVPENASMNTPAPIFTVIGAEGLQRVIDEPEETFDNKYLKDESQHNEPQNEIIEDDQINNSTNYNISDLTSNNVYTENTPTIDNLDLTSSEDPDKILREVISELYETTTVGSGDSSSEENNQIKDTDSIDMNIIRKDAKLESGSTEIESSREIIDTYESTTFEPSIVPVKSVNNIFDEEQQAIPIEHLPEHNPEYPPIPEDIMILSMTEDSLETVSSESEYSGSHPISNNDKKDDDRIILVKRPVIGHPAFSNMKKEKENNEKILPDVYQLVKNNETNSEDNNTLTIMPEEWLKSSEETETISKVDSPLLDLKSALPDNILLSSPEYKESNEDDDSQDYIFISNITTNTASSVVKQELFTEESSGLTDATEVNNLRSPGEPLLIPEWERNQTSYENVTTENTITSDNTTDDFIEINGEANSSSTERINVHNENKDNVNEALVIDDTKIDSSPMEDTITNFIISTENTLISKPSIFIDIEKEKNVDVDESFAGNIHTKKQKKTSSLLAEEKNDNSNDLTKKGNILADLISLVGDVASIGNQDVEVSSVRNAIDEEIYTNVDRKIVDNSNSKIDLTTARNIMLTHSDLSHASAKLELSEYSDERIDNIPLENDKVEFTTKKMVIDKDGDDRAVWKSTDHLIKDIEIIPKESNSVKKPSLEKFVNNKEDNQNSVTAKVQNKTKIVTPEPVATTNPPMKIENFDTKENLPTTLSTLLSTLAESAKSNDTESSKLLNNILQTVTIERAETTESSYPTVMKVSTKSDANSIDKSDEDKLTKRETNSQLRESSGQIDESLISILRDFFEKQYRN